MKITKKVGNVSIEFEAGNIKDTVALLMEYESVKDQPKESVLNKKINESMSCGGYVSPSVFYRAGEQ